MTENVDTYVTTTEADKIISETYPPASPLAVSWAVLTEQEKEGFLRGGNRETRKSGKNAQP